MESSQIDISSFVDSHFLNHNHARKTHDTSECSTCSAMQSSKCPKHAKEAITRNDIDLLELMNPTMTPDSYMDNIMQLYRKQQDIRCREEKNQPMQLALSTRKIVSKRNIIEEVSQEEEEEDEGVDVVSHPEQFKTDKTAQRHVRRLREECYLSLGKLIISRQEKKNRVELQRANYYTRQYLLPNAKEQMQRLQNQADRSKDTTKFYILANANSKGVNFEPQEMPWGLDCHIESFKYREIICTVNEIIQRRVYSHKKNELMHKHTNPLYIWLMVGLVVVVSLLLLNSLQIHSIGLEMSCLVSSLCLILFIMMISCHEFHKRLDYVPLLQRINKGITQYLDYLNSRPGSSLQWVTPSHLYWIQVTLVQSEYKYLGKSFIS